MGIIALEKAIIKYHEKTGIDIHQLKHYLTDGRLYGILEIYDKEMLKIKFYSQKETEASKN